MTPDSPTPNAGERMTTEFLLLPDGVILVQNLTPVMAEILLQLNPNEEAIRRRVAASQVLD